MSIKRILLAIGVIGASTLAITTYQSQSNDIQPTEPVVEQVESKEPLKTATEPSESKTVDVTKSKVVEPKQSIVERNPNNCDHDTQWIWEDGSCHDKEVPVEITAEPEPVATYSTDCESYRPLLEQYDWNVDHAMMTMRLESGCRASVVSPTNDHGLFQINGGLSRYGSAVYDPATNIDIAYRDFYASRGWTPWYAVQGILW